MFAKCARVLKSIWSFFEKNFSKWYYGLIKSSFHSPAENFSPEGQKFLAHFWKRIEHIRIFQKNFILPSFFVETYISALAILLEVFWQRTGEDCPMNRNVKKIHFFEKDYIRMLFGTRRKLFLQPELICLLSKNDEQNFFWNALLRIYL